MAARGAVNVHSSVVGCSSTGLAGHRIAAGTVRSHDCHSVYKCCGGQGFLMSSGIAKLEATAELRLISYCRKKSEGHTSSSYKFVRATHAASNALP